MNLISLMNEKIDDAIIVTCASTHLRLDGCLSGWFKF